MSKIYVVSPTRVATGGTELLQQLCYYLNQFGFESYMYYTGVYKDSPVENRFAVYDNPIAQDIDDCKENVLILSETKVDFIFKFKKIKTYIWWLSVDNYYGSKKKRFDLAHEFVYSLKDFKNGFAFKKCLHLVQSEYARHYLIEKRHVKQEHIRYLSDYLNKTYLDEAKQELSEQRKNNILYNPKKGIEFTKLLMEEITEYNWIPLQNLTPVQMRKLLSESKVYIDFGNHPGKDRIPREAAISGCCVITGKRGSAANSIDVPIPNEYKFEDNGTEIKKIHAKISECMDYYEDKRKDFLPYIDMITNEEDRFKQDIHRVFDEYKEN